MKRTGAMMDMITSDGRVSGAVANMLANRGSLDVGRMKPFVDLNTGVAYVTVCTGDPRKKESYKAIPLQTNATAVLQRDEWKQLDEAVVGVARQRLVGIQDLIDMGLTYNLGNAMGTTVLEWHDVSDAFEADLTMDGITRSKGDRPVYQHNYLPIPIIHVDYEINARVLSTSRNMGNALDTTSAERAARKVSDKLEDMLFTNTTYGFGELDSRSRNKIYSYINFPDRNIKAIGTHWDDLATPGATIVAQVLEMKQQSLDDYHYGPWRLYIPSNYETVIDEDYDATTPGTTIRERIMKIKGITDIKVIDRMPADNVVLVEMNKETVRLVRGLGVQNIQWSEEGGMLFKYKVLTIQVPQIRSDQDGHCGIVHMA